MIRVSSKEATYRQKPTRQNEATPLAAITSVKESKSLSSAKDC